MKEEKISKWSVPKTKLTEQKTDIDIYFNLHYTIIDYLGIEYDVISTTEYKF